MAAPIGASSAGGSELKGCPLPAVVFPPERNKGTGTSKRDVGVHFLGIQRVRKEKNIYQKMFPVQSSEGKKKPLGVLFCLTKFCNMRESHTRRVFWSQVYPEEKVFST